MYVKLRVRMAMHIYDTRGLWSHVSVKGHGDFLNNALAWRGVLVVGGETGLGSVMRGEGKEDIRNC